MNSITSSGNFYFRCKDSGAYLATSIIAQLEVFCCCTSSCRDMQVISSATTTSVYRIWRMKHVLAAVLESQSLHVSAQCGIGIGYRSLAGSTINEVTNIDCNGEESCANT